MRAWLLLLLPGILMAQDAAPLGIAAGDMEDWDGGPSSGHFRVRTEEKLVYNFLFDSRTHFEREQQRISVSTLKKGEWLVIVADRGPAPDVRYARIVRAFNPDRKPDPPVARKFPHYRGPTEDFIPRGNLTYSGMVTKITSSSLAVRTRSEGEKIFVLRPDTRYMEGGSLTEISTLKENARVFVRAGRNLDGILEAYSVISGEILFPERIH